MKVRKKGRQASAAGKYRGGLVAATMPLGALSEEQQRQAFFIQFIIFNYLGRHV